VRVPFPPRPPAWSARRRRSRQAYERWGLRRSVPGSAMGRVPAPERAGMAVPRWARTVGRAGAPAAGPVRVRAPAAGPGRVRAPAAGPVRVRAPAAGPVRVRAPAGPVRAWAQAGGLRGLQLGG
jgi:hypothetical protein